jgi:hypothetical protein
MIVKKATQCGYHYVCVNAEQLPKCSIRKVVQRTLFFTQEKIPSCCFYQCPFGDAFMCTCPVRQELYLKYKI